MSEHKLKLFGYKRIMERIHFHSAFQGRRTKTKKKKWGGTHFKGTEPLKKWDGYWLYCNTFQECKFSCFVCCFALLCPPCLNCTSLVLISVTALGTTRTIPNRRDGCFSSRCRSCWTSCASFASDANHRCGSSHFGFGRENAFDYAGIVPRDDLT